MHTPRVHVGGGLVWLIGTPYHLAEHCEPAEHHHPAASGADTTLRPPHTHTHPSIPSTHPPNPLPRCTHLLLCMMSLQHTTSPLMRVL